MFFLFVEDVQVYCWWVEPRGGAESVQKVRKNAFLNYRRELGSDIGSEIRANTELSVLMVKMYANMQKRTC